MAKEYQYLDAAPAPSAEHLAAIAKAEQEAKDQRARAEESFQRSDTDGFLSQWASNIGAELNDEKVKLWRNGGWAQFAVLVYQGKVIATKVWEFPDTFAPDQWNNPMKRMWRVPDELVGTIGRKWIPYGEGSRVQKKLGLSQERRWMKAEAKITTGGRKSTGLSGCANAFVAVFKYGTEEMY
jgi:hypothetical protein